MKVILIILAVIILLFAIFGVWSMIEFTKYSYRLGKDKENKIQTGEKGEEK